MDRQTFEQALSFLERSNIKEVRMLGGEPTLHPNFSEFVNIALEREFRLFIFSNGYMPETALRLLEEIPEEKVKVLINVVTDPENFDGLDKKQIAFFQRLSSKIIPGFNIDTASVQFDFLLDIVLKFNTTRKIRLGLAHPKMEGDNHFLHPRYYPVVGKKIADFMRKTKPYGIEISFDCGFVPCMFPEDSFALIGQDIANLGNRCNPILDILPEGQVISCFPLANFQQELILEDMKDADLRQIFINKQKPFRSMMLYKKCHTCEYRLHGYCVGGCLSASMQRQRTNEFTFSLPAVN